MFILIIVVIIVCIVGYIIYIERTIQNERNKVQNKIPNDYQLDCKSGICEFYVDYINHKVLAISYFLGSHQEQEIGSIVKTSSSCYNDNYFILDDTNKQILFVKGHKLTQFEHAIIPFSKILGIEIEEDGCSVYKKGISKTIIGGFIGGSTGAVIGNLLEDKKEQKVLHSYKIIIQLKDSAQPILELELIDGEPCEKDNNLQKYSNTIKSVITQIIESNHE